MEFLGQVMPILLYFLGAVLLFVIILLCLKLVDTVEKVNVLLDDIIAKSKSLDNLFGAIDSVGDTISSINLKFVNTISSIVGKLFKRRKAKKNIEEDLEEEEDYE